MTRILLILQIVDPPVYPAVLEARDIRPLLLSPVNVRRDPMRDFWNTPYHFTQERGHTLIRSAGPDRRLDTADDICSAKIPGVWLAGVVTQL